MSVDLNKEVEIPRIVLMYFAYQSNLDYEHCAYLYAYLQKHREEFPELYLAYKSQIDRFVLHILLHGQTYFRKDTPSSPCRLLIRSSEPARCRPYPACCPLRQRR